MLPVGSKVLSMHGYEGIIAAMYDDFSAIQFLLGPKSYAWEKIQSPPLNEQEKRERWYLVRVYTGGSIWSPESRLEPELHV